jgi:hypothetical protein
MKLSKAHSYYERYLYVVRNYGYRTVNLCYKAPSPRKINAEAIIATELYRKGGYGYTVISYNAQMFTCGYLYQHNGATYFVIHTPTDREVMLVKGE